MNQTEKANSWICNKCQKELISEKVEVKYLEGNFEVEMLRCPKCKMVYVNEELALGKMLEVEKGLEDK